MNRSKTWKFEDVQRKWLDELSYETARAYGGALLRAKKLCPAGDFLKVDEPALKSAILNVASVAMKRRIVSALHSFFAYALDVGAVPSDPSRRIKLRILGSLDSGELLKASGLRAQATWGDVLRLTLGSRAGTTAADDLFRRLMVRLRRCQTPASLRSMLRKRVAND